MIYFPTIFLYGGCCFGGRWSIKETHPHVCTSLHSQHCSGLVSMERTVQQWKPNYWISASPFDRWDHPGILRSSFIWQIIQPGLNLLPVNNKVDGFQPVNIFRFAEKGRRWRISHFHFLHIYCMLLWQSMCKCSFPSLFIKAQDVTQLSPVS